MEPLGKQPAQVQEQDLAFDTRISRPFAVRLEKPAGLEAGESFVEPSFAPLVVRKDAHRVVVAQLVYDEAEAGAAVHDHHREFGAAPFDAVHVGDLRPCEFAVQRIEPGERHLRAYDSNALSPRRAVAGLVEDTHHDVLVAAFLVAVTGVERAREMLDGLRRETNTLA